jgi:hypothetical protein
MRKEKNNMRGEKGTKVGLKVEREGDGGLEQVEVGLRGDLSDVELLVERVGCIGGTSVAKEEVPAIAAGQNVGPTVRSAGSEVAVDNSCTKEKKKERKKHIKNAYSRKNTRGNEADRFG